MFSIIESKHWGKIALVLIKGIHGIILEITFAVFWKHVTLDVFKRSVISNR